MDLSAKLAELRAKKAAEAAAANTAPTPAAEPVVTSVPAPTPEPAPAAAIQTPSYTATNPTQGAGTAKTSEIDHLDFLSKLGELQEAIHKQHPKMPVLLMLIHRQLRADPELVTTLDEEAIGIIVNGLKIQTKTELVGTIVKQSKARDKKVKLDASMF